MKLFEFRREVDESGVSGTGVVAQGIIFDNGKCAVCWLTTHSSITMYDSIEDVIAIHGHGGKTKFVQIFDCNKLQILWLLTNRGQDMIEGVSCGLSKNGKYLWEERESFASLFEEKDLSINIEKDLQKSEEQAKKQKALSIINMLNGVLTHDREAIEKLIEHRVECSEQRYNHPSIQTDTEGGVGMLGILNGIVGVIDDGIKKGCGWIVAVYDDDGKLTHFKLNEPKKEK